MCLQAEKPKHNVQQMKTHHMHFVASLEPMRFELIAIIFAASRSHLYSKVPPSMGVPFE
jgi:hypothetical protein